MSIALPALVVFIVLFPGIVVRSRIKLVEQASLDYSPFGQIIAEAVVWSAILHTVWIALMHVVTTRVFRPDLVLKLLGTDTTSQTRALDQVAARAYPVLLYFGSLTVAAYLGAYAFRRVVKAYRLDRLGSRFDWVFRFTKAPWYYLLSGADFDVDHVPDFIAVSAIVNIGGQPILFTGILGDFFLDKDGNLDRVVLKEVMRRPLSKDKDGEAEGPQLERFYPIEGDYFVLRYSEAITLNIEYIKLEISEHHAANDFDEGALAP